MSRQTLRSLGIAILSFAVLGLLGYFVHASIFGPSRETSVMQSYDISRAESDAATVEVRVVSDGEWTPFGSSSTSIIVIYNVVDGSFRETVITDLLEAAEADGWDMEDLSTDGSILWRARRDYGTLDPNQSIQLTISSRNQGSVTLTVTPHNTFYD